MKLRKAQTGDAVLVETIAPAAAAVSTHAPGPSASSSGRKLGEELIERGFLTQAELDKILTVQEKSGGRLGQLLLQHEVIDEERLTDALAAHLGLERVNLKDRDLERDAISDLPENLARRLKAVPLGRANERVEVALADPTPEALADLKKAAGDNVNVFLATPSEVHATIEQLYKALAGIEQYIDSFARTAKVSAANDTAAQMAGEDAPVVKVVNLILMQAQRDGVSDVHIEPQADGIRVRFRIDGALKDVQKLPLDMNAAIVSRIKILAGMNIVERRRPQDGQFAAEFDGKAMDVRVATTATVWGEKAVLRLLDKSRALYTLDELGMPDDTADAYQSIVRSPFGMVICAGPTGAGKTTTLYATLNEINDPERNIMTIEDPVEYIFPNINQIQMNEGAGLSFADGLKSMLRQDPDVILVGEIRDAETARIAVQSALTGHFVLSSIHATDTAAALHRFLDMGVEAFLISSSVLGIVSQRLVRRICDGCKEEYEPTEEDLAFYEDGGGKAKTAWFHGAGCNMCADTGYKGRIGVYELLRITPELKRLVVGWATQDEIRRMAVNQGMRTLKQEGIALVENDTTTVTEVIRSVYAI